MSRFCDSIYTIVPMVDVTTEMVNKSGLGFNSTLDSMKKSLDGSLVLFKFKREDSDVFIGYEWLNKDEVVKIISTSDWVEK